MFADFGAVATIGAASVSGLFDSAYGESLNGMATGFVPVFSCASSDVLSIAEGQALSIGAMNFTVASVEHDSTLKNGLATLRLEKA